MTLLERRLQAIRVHVVSQAKSLSNRTRGYFGNNVQLGGSAQWVSSLRGKNGRVRLGAAWNSRPLAKEPESVGAVEMGPADPRNRRETVATTTALDEACDTRWTSALLLVRRGLCSLICHYYCRCKRKNPFGVALTLPHTPPDYVARTCILVGRQTAMAIGARTRVREGEFIDRCSTSLACIAPSRSCPLLRPSV